MKSFILGLVVLSGVWSVSLIDVVPAYYLAGMVILGLVAYRVARKG